MIVSRPAGHAGVSVRTNGRQWCSRRAFDFTTDIIFLPEQINAWLHSSARASVRFRCTSESLEACMTKLLLTVAFTAMSASLAVAQQASDPRVADLVQAGKIRVGMHSIMYTKDSRTGEFKAASTGIILLDIARTLGARIGAEVVPVGHPTIPEMLT